MITKQSLFLGTAGILALLISGCATFSEYGKLEESARENYVRGNYDQAIFGVVNSLKIKPDYEESQQLAKEVFPKAVDAHLGKIKEAKDGNAKFRWDTVVSEYDALIQINKEIKSLPTLTDKNSKAVIQFDVQDYIKPISEAKTNAAEEHYQEGRSLFGKEGMVKRDQAGKEFGSANGFVPGYKDASALAAEGYYQEGLLLSKKDDVDIKKQAAKAFTAAQKFVPGYKDAAALYDKARKAGIKRIAIIPFENKSGKGGQYGAVADAIVDGIVSNVMNDPDATEFLEIVSRDQLESVMAEQRLGTTGLIDAKTATQLGKLLGAHEILIGQITQIAVSPAQTTTKNIRQEAVVCDRIRKYIKDGKEREECISDKVTALVTIYNRKAGVTISGSYKVIDVKTAKLKDTQQLSGKYEFSAAWAKFSGDERALQGEPKSLASANEENAPVDEEMVGMAEKDLTEKLSSTLKKYAR